ncbi:MAG: efflux RND transporter permease subunit, partial [Bacteroidales bacterium]
MKFIVNRVITIFMLFLAFAVLGYISYRELKLELLPNAELPVLYVQVSSSGTVDPAYMENQVIIPIEGVISQLDGIESIESKANSNGGNVQIKLKKRTNLKYASIKLQEKINAISSTLPDGIKASVQKGMDGSMSGNFMMLQIRGEGGVDRIRNIFEEKAKSQLENIDGVASVNLFGGRQKAIEVCLDKEVCKAYGLTPEQISTAIRNYSQSRTFVGNVTDNEQKLFVHVDAEYEQLSELENIVVAANSVLLKDIATIFFDFKEEVSYSRVNGMEAISCAVTNDAQSNIIDLSHRITETINILNEDLKPQGIEIIVQSNTAEVMEKNLKEISWSAVIGGILAVIILWFFLKNLRLVIIIALSIPLSILTAFNIFYAL